MLQVSDDFSSAHVVMTAGVDSSARDVDRPGPKTSSALLSVVRGALIGLLLALVVLPGFAFFRASAAFAVPMIAGAVLGFVADSYLGVLVGSTLFGAGLALLESSWLSWQSVFTAINDSAKTQASVLAHYPAVIGAFIGAVWFPLVRASDVSKLGIFGLIVLAVALCAGVSSGFIFLRSAGTFDRLLPHVRERFALGTGEQLVGKILMVIVLAGLFFSANVAAKPFDARVDTYLVKGSYATDYMVYVRTIQDVARGNNYYASLKKATLDDARANKPDRYIMPRASWVRLPALPWVLARVGGQKLSIDVTLALLLGAIAAGFVGWALEQQLFPGAGMIVALLVMPYFAMIGTWEPAFLADYWGGILALLAFGLLLNRLTYPAIIASVFGALAREHFLFWLFGVGLGMIWLAVARKRWAPAVATAGGGALVVGAYLAHWRIVNTHYRWILTGKHSAGSVPGLIIGWTRFAPASLMGSTLLGVSIGWTGFASGLARLSSIMDFGFMPYTLYRYNSVWFLLPAFAFLVWRVVRALLTHKVAAAELAAIVFVGIEVAQVFTHAYYSQYWSVMFMPLVLAATAGLACELIGVASATI